MPEVCAGCGIELSPSLLVCPRCHALAAAFTRSHACSVIAYAISHEGLLILVGLAAAWRAFQKEVEHDHDWIAFAQFVVLIGLGAALSVVPVPTSR